MAFLTSLWSGSVEPHVRRPTVHSGSQLYPCLTVVVIPHNGSKVDFTIMQSAVGKRDECVNKHQCNISGGNG